MERDEELTRDLDAQVTTLGYELVDLERGGSRARPILRLRIDRPGAEPGKGVTVEDCTRVSRAIEHYLEERTDIGETYVLEVSSPGLERPLVKRSDWERFSGREVAVKTHHANGEHGKRVEGLLRGISEDDVIRIELASKEVVDIPRGDVVRAHLIFRWEEK